MSRMFGTDGVRGVAGTELTIELAMKLGQAGAYVLTKKKAHQPTIIVGCDMQTEDHVPPHQDQPFPLPYLHEDPQPL